MSFTPTTKEASEKSVKQILSEARELISDPAKWTQGTLARDINGRAASPLDPFAVCWCAVGAVRKAIGEEDFNKTRFLTKYQAAITALNVATGDVDDIERYNDCTNHNHVLYAFELAISKT